MEAGLQRALLVGPYDPHCGEYTFLAPPLGVWRLKGVLTHAGIDARVFDPNCCDGSPEDALQRVLEDGPWTMVGFSTTGMTLRFDLALAHQARRALPDAVMIAGGMEATFRPDLMFDLGPFDLVALGEGEGPLLALAERMSRDEPLEGITGTAHPGPDGGVVRHHQIALGPEEMRDAIALTPYEEMPYERYWERLEQAYRVQELPMKAEREARLAEIRSVRLITLNYCPMGCSFCSSTNFLNEAQGGVARIRKLSAQECYDMILMIMEAQPRARTVIFQDDIFVFTSDDRILPLCEMIVAGKESGELPSDLQFISTNRIDSMSKDRMRAMRDAGFRVLGFGVESFSPAILEEFNKARIVPYIETNLAAALELGITPFLDLILTSPRCSIQDLARTIRESWRWLVAGCELGMYPYVIPFSGAVLANDPTLAEHTVSTRYRIAGTAIEFDQPSKILPVDPVVRDAILRIEESFGSWIEELHPHAPHLPSRLRSMVWTLAASPILTALRQDVPSGSEVLEQLFERLPGVPSTARTRIEQIASHHAHGARRAS